MMMQRPENINTRYNQLPIGPEQQTPFFDGVNLSPQLPHEVSL